MKKKFIWLLIIFLFFSGCTAQAPVKIARSYLGTLVEITVADQDKSREIINTAIEKAFAEIERVEALLSRFDSRSEISQINVHSGIQPVKVSIETIRLIEQSIAFSRLTAGAFDITIYPLLEIWGMAQGSSPQHIPTTEQIREALDRVGYQYIKISRQQQTVFLTQPAMSLDLGAIAKGYAVDRAVAILRHEGIQHALVNAGGDVYAMGNKNKAKKWRVAIQHPRKENTFLATLELSNKAAATSGDYQQYIEIDGKRYSHIINPKTGLPVENSPCSVTVLAQDCTTSDALATSLFVLGPKKGIDLVNQREDTEAIVVSCQQRNNLDIVVSQGLKEKTAIMKILTHE
jgi:thiamine biosynthesis lipoprotein